MLEWFYIFFLVVFDSVDKDAFDLPENVSYNTKMSELSKSEFSVLLTCSYTDSTSFNIQLYVL